MNRFLFFVLTLLATVSMRAHAATFVVTRLDDPAPNGCQPGDCSLREAAIAADGNDPFAARDVIQLGVGTCTLTLGVLPLNQNLEVTSGFTNASNTSETGFRISISVLATGTS